MPTRPSKHRPALPSTARHELPELSRQTRREMHTGVKRWLAIREFTLRRDRFTCQACGRIVAGKGEAHVDHVDGDSHNNPPDGSNWQTLCVPCHSAKTAKENGGFGNSPSNESGSRLTGGGRSKL
ncbi:hypothetical protein PMO31116_04653 [Pandoraea morbifera]|uniref:Putative HNH nuclease YajD n=1 Tax=Pandoraea morbifera TaxID=2508300 RepID=A0A5E4YRD8_9BURK|nr:hypothetical protein PMO31116_04653 [Pandoraea morbifera]